MKLQTLTYIAGENSHKMKECLFKKPFLFKLLIRYITRASKFIITRVCTLLGQVGKKLQHSSVNGLRAPESIPTFISQARLTEVKL